ncbi:putative Tigger transposable element-derived protein 1-like 337 [Homarus americanus]|uniref:Putative Tigger transposable element-derived protein 1-like 337 n=1 Tax=Homarus americanus TaxID=6706 RepID=A0A8J5MNP5_HOMAM|nr:putative Tigger transposable element-derived protein 1-like 337 [Homarus americanus]
MRELVHQTANNHRNIKEFWNAFNIKKAIVHINKSWKEMSQQTMNGIWRKIWLECVHSFVGFGDVGTVRKCSRTLLTFLKRLGLRRWTGHTSMFTICFSHTSRTSPMKNSCSFSSRGFMNKWRTSQRAT